MANKTTAKTTARAPRARKNNQPATPATPVLAIGALLAITYDAAAKPLGCKPGNFLARLDSMSDAQFTVTFALASKPATTVAGKAISAKPARIERAILARDSSNTNALLHLHSTRGTRIPCTYAFATADQQTPELLDVLKQNS